MENENNDNIFEISSSKYVYVLKQIEILYEGSIFHPRNFCENLQGLIVMTLMSGGANRRSGGSRRNIQRIFRKINYYVEYITPKTRYLPYIDLQKYGISYETFNPIVSTSLVPT